MKLQMYSIIWPDNNKIYYILLIKGHHITTTYNGWFRTSEAFFYSSCSDPYDLGTLLGSSRTQRPSTLCCLKDEQNKKNLHRQFYYLEFIQTSTEITVIYLKKQVHTNKIQPRIFSNYFSKVKEKLIVL